MSGLYARVTSSTVNPGPGSYNPKLGTTSDKPRAPEFSLKGRHESSTNVNTAPYRDLPSSIGSGPKISLASRHATRDVENTPGPGYVPPALGADAPKVAMSYRHSEVRDSRADNPGPGAYYYKAQFGNEAPKAYMHSRTGDPMGINSVSPGPGAYNPDYSSQKKRAPSASMHIRPESRSIETSPGPSDYQIDRSLGGQASTMHARTGDPMGINSISPGPGAYNPSDSMKPKAPSFTMKGRHESVERPNTAPYRDLPSTIGQGPKISLASRHATRDVENTPGPAYIPPALGADAPKVAMSYRHGEVRDSRADNPGPGAYNYQPTFANEAPKAYMHTRNGDPMGINSISPGPGAYSPDYNTQKSRAPSASMHIRPESRSIETSPGPSDYQIDRSLGGQKSTMHSRTGDPMGINSISPGPGAYNPGDANKTKAPSYTMKGRHESTSQVNTAPYRDLPSSIGQGPKISLGSRHATRDVENTPGPAYIPPALGADAPKVAMSYRHGEVRDSRADNPGPGAYDYKAQFGNEAPKAYMHSRTGDPMGINSISPGPGAYSPDYNSQKKRAPSASMHIRPESRSIETSPGPSDYQIDRSLGGQASTMHARTGDPMGINSISPGPGAYNPGDAMKPKAPSFTMKGRHESVERPNTAPYRDLPSTIGQGPKISLASRHATRDVENTPGPNYVPPALGADAPKVAMSYRHGEVRDSRADNPGPGAYDYKAQFGNEAPKAYMHSRNGDPMGINSVSPGPGAYNPDYSTQKPRAPSSSMHIRPKDRTGDTTPGYTDLGSTLTGPAFTIGLRENLGMIPV